jgi:tetratricopeptide (TPR) repeat protein
MKKLYVLLLTLCVISVIGFASYREYSVWTQKRLLRAAHDSLTAGNIPATLLALHNVLELNPNNTEACRLMGDFAELARSGEALEWRRRLVNIQPDSLTNRLLLERTALELGDVATAHTALDGVGAAGKNTSIYHQAAGALALVEHQMNAAAEQFQEALKLDPSNPEPQLNLAVIQLQSVDPLAADAGHRTLQALSSNPAIRYAALQQLAVDAVRHTNTAQALKYSWHVLAQTNATFNDRLSHLELLFATQDNGEPAFLAQLQRETATNSTDAYKLGRWLLANSKPATTLLWVKTLPPNTRTNLPMPLLETDCRMLLQDWSGILTNLSGQYWGRLECSRHVSCVRAYKELKQPTSAKAEWIQALNATDNQADLLQQLMDASTRWDWPAEQEDVLWAIVNHYPDNLTALQLLTERLYRAGRTRTLMTLSSQALQTHKNNLDLMNNLASTALLLGAWEKKPNELADKVYHRCPTNTSYVCTYAYSLLLRKQPAEALEIMKKFSDAQLENPSLAAYYGVILNAAGKHDQARHYLELAEKAVLLPEEQKLVIAARK